MSVALRDQRLLVYNAEASTYTEGFAFTSYAVEASTEADGAWWASFVTLDPFSLAAGLQQEVGTRAKANFHSEVPVTETSLIRDTATGRLYKVSGVTTLERADTKVVACEWREDASYTITSDVAAYTIDSVVVEPDPATVTVGTETTQRFTATALNADGDEVPGLVPTWASSAPAVLMMAGTGVGEGLAAGTATVTATMGDVSGTAEVEVVE